MTMSIWKSWRHLSILPLLALLTAPAVASAQSELDTSQAQLFLGSWTLSFESEMGPSEVGLNLRDAEGTVGAQLTSQLGDVEITTITRSEDSLVLSYTMDAEGQSFPVSLNLKPDGEQLQASMDFGGGTFMVSGTATRAVN